jgi:hypothetical protein
LLKIPLLKLLSPPGPRPEPDVSGFEKTGDGGKIVAMNSFLFALIQRSVFPEVLVDRDG